MALKVFKIYTLIHFKQESFDMALKLTNKALSINPSHAQAYQLRAQLNIKNGKINDAKKDYLTAIHINPDYINAQYNLALLYDIYLQDIPAAIKHYEIYSSLIKITDEPTQEWINHLKGTLKMAKFSILFFCLLLNPVLSAAEDRIELKTTIIIGNKELPKILYIVPWKEIKKNG